MNLEEFKNKTILLFGKSRAFEAEEFHDQLALHNITLAQEYSDEVAAVVEGRMMSPYEQNRSDELYEQKGVRALSIDVLEKALAQEIDADTLLMSLKLSHDKARLKSFLQNSMIDDAVFLKLLSMYSWGGEDFFENDDNRDVSAALIVRFYKNIERNHNVQYATTGLYHLVLQTQNIALLEAIAILEPLQKHREIMSALLTHEKVSRAILKRFLKRDDAALNEAMAHNPHLDKSIAKELIKNTSFAQIIAKNIMLDDELFALLFAHSELLASNETLSEDMQKKLLALPNKKVHIALAGNRGVDATTLCALLAFDDVEINSYIFANSACSQELLHKAYEDEKNFIALASNSATPQTILKELFELTDEEVLCELAKNENTPVELLYQLQLESRFERAVKTNAAFAKHIQSQNIGWLV